MTKPIPLDPGAGGRSIPVDALEPADIIVATTAAGMSRAIRAGTLSTVSHAALYCGSSEVIEAIGEGVVDRTIQESLAHDVLAVAYRSPSMTSTIATAILRFASAQVGKSYTVLGALASTDPIECRLLGPRPASFFCSQLVIEAYARGGLALTSTPSQCVTPEAVVRIAANQLQYVGHILGRSSWFPVLSP
jgi:cell wall-associated NlpC family hydrolase